MKTPTAIFLGLALIAAAIFFREPPISPAHAATCNELWIVNSVNDIVWDATKHVLNHLID